MRSMVVLPVVGLTISSEQATLVGCLLSSYIFSFIYYWTLLHSKNHTIKYIYLSLVGALFLLVCYNWTEWIQLVALVLFSYIYTKIFRKNPWMPSSHFMLCLLWLSFSHLYRQFGPNADPSVYTNDITGPLMMMVMKLTSFAFDISDSFFFNTRKRDGNPEKEEDISSESADQDLKKQNDSKIHRFSVLGNFPEFLEFAAYCLLFPGLLTGPTITFYEFRTFINGSYFSGIDHNIVALTGRKQRATKQFLIAVSFMMLYALYLDKIPVSYVLTEEYQSKSWSYKLAYLHISNLVWRSKYYFAWLIAEGSYVIIGLGFRLSSSGRPLWDKLENVNPLRIETATDMRLLISSWNVCTNQWLNHYVYKRLQNYYGKNSSSMRASLFTYIISALWHGFYPGYYLLFISAAWMTILARLIYKNFTCPVGSTAKKLILWAPFFALINYHAVPFKLLLLRPSIEFLKSFYFAGHIFMLLLSFYFVILGFFNKKVARRASDALKFEKHPISIN